MSKVGSVVSMSNPLIDQAIEFATAAHEGQFRKGRRQEPYIHHPAEVAVIVAEAGGSEEEVIAAWLHDTVEDTPTTLMQIVDRFGHHIALIVDGLTDPKEFEPLPTLERKKRQAKRLGTKSASVKRVKLADQIANLSSLATDPPTAWTLGKCLEYAEGIQLVAKACLGVNPLLDSKYHETSRAFARSLQQRK